MKDSIVQGKG